MEQALYIDGVAMDIDSDTSVTLTIASNLFRDITKMTANSTATIRLPRTARNSKVLGHADVVQSGTVIPYEKHSCRYFRGGVEVIRDGQAVLLSVAEKFELTIIWGISSAISAISSDTAKLTNIKSDARLVWGSGILPEAYENIKRGYFYAAYNPFARDDVNTAWKNKNVPQGSYETTHYELTLGAIITGSTIGESISAKPDTTRINFGCVCFSVTAGDRVTIYRAVGADDARVYAFCDASYNVIELADYTTEAPTYTLTAPAAAAWCVVNASTPQVSNTSVQRTRGTYITSRARAAADDSTRGHGTAADRYVHPCVSVDWLLERIADSFGVSFTWPQAAKDFIGTLAVPLIANKADEQTLTSVASGSAAYYGVVPQKMKWLDLLISPSNIFNPSSSQGSQIITASTSVTVDANVQCRWNVKPEFNTTTGDYEEVTDEDGNKTRVYTDRVNSLYLILRVDYAEDGKDSEDFVIGAKNDDFIDVKSTETMSDGKVHYLAYGGGRIELSGGDKISIAVKTSARTTAPYPSIDDVEFTFRTVMGDEVPRGGNYPIAKNLPDIKVTDLVRFLNVITGTFPRQMDGGSTLEFVEIAQIWRNRGKAVDWSSRLVPMDNTNRPRSQTFSVSDWAQANWYKWKEDELVRGNYDGSINISNKSLDETRDVVTFPFAASDDDEVPHYKQEYSEDLTDFPTVSSQSCKDRILQVYDKDGTAALTFGDALHMDNIVAAKYSELAEAISEAKVLKEYVKLTDIDLMRFDETIPVFFAQYGAYFAVTELKQTTKGYCEATMLKIKL